MWNGIDYPHWRAVIFEWFNYSKHFLLFAYIGSLYLSELLPLQQLSMELAQSLNGVKKAKQILDLPIFDSVGDFPKSHDVTLKSVRFSYDGKTDVLTDCDLHVAEGEK